MKKGSKDRRDFRDPFDTGYVSEKHLSTWKLLKWYKPDVLHCSEYVETVTPLLDCVPVITLPASNRVVITMTDSAMKLVRDFQGPSSCYFGLDLPPENIFMSVINDDCPKEQLVHDSTLEQMGIASHRRIEARRRKRARQESTQDDAEPPNKKRRIKKKRRKGKKRRLAENDIRPAKRQRL